jgi:hypothetical protein
MVALYLLVASAANPLTHIANYATMAECQAAASGAQTIASGRVEPASTAPMLGFICVPLPRPSVGK